MTLANNTRLTARPSRSKLSGFSLIEVTIAVAITAVALVSLMGMLPQGMKTMARAGDTAIEARIHQQIVGELLLTEWENRSVFDKQVRGFDDQGIHIATDGATFVTGRNAEDIIYQSRIRVPTVDVTLPGGESDPNLQLVLVDVTNRSEDGFDFDNPNNQSHVHTYQSIIAKMGQNFQSTRP